jgi:hypothetical protein
VVYNIKINVNSGINDVGTYIQRKSIRSYGRRHSISCILASKNVSPLSMALSIQILEFRSSGNAIREVISGTTVYDSVRPSNMG